MSQRWSYEGQEGYDTNETSPSPADLRKDPLMNTMHDQMRGYHYSNWKKMDVMRHQRIDRILDAMKAQEQIPECMIIDKLLQRAAFHAMMEPLYAPHYERFRGKPWDLGRDGYEASDDYMAALMEHMIAHGFTSESSAAFRGDPEEIATGSEAYADEAYNMSDPPPMPKTWLDETCHMYSGGGRQRSLFNRIRMNKGT
jgi:hypothetical protein